MTNAFDTSGPSLIGKELEHNARNSRKGAKMVEKLRADGDRKSTRLNSSH